MPAETSHQGVLLTSDAGPVHDGSGGSRRQDFGLSTFVDERIPIIGQEASFVHGAFIDHLDAGNYRAPWNDFGIPVRIAWGTNDRTLPVKLCFPLVGCILPAFVLLTIAPLIAGALRSLTV